MHQGIYKIKKAAQIADKTYDFTVACPEIAAEAKAGQFLHIRCGEFTLRRPISICALSDDRTAIRIVFEVRGEGTVWLAARGAGERLDIMGPLGNGFPDLDGRILLVGGGIGTPPLLQTAKEHSGKVDAILGFRGKEAVILEADFRAACAAVHVTTDDGSYGEKGFTTNVMPRLCAQKAYDAVFACGPQAMLRGIAEIAAQRSVPCYVSLEERMACGVGACLVCVCAVQKDGEAAYRPVCEDGPVFRAEEIIWE